MLKLEMHYSIFILTSSRTFLDKSHHLKFVRSLKIFFPSKVDVDSWILQFAISCFVSFKNKFVKKSCTYETYMEYFNIKRTSWCAFHLMLAYDIPRSLFFFDICCRQSS